MIKQTRTGLLPLPAGGKRGGPCLRNRCARADRDNSHTWVIWVGAPPAREQHLINRPQLAQGCPVPDRREKPLNAAEKVAAIAMAATFFADSEIKGQVSRTQEPRPTARRPFPCRCPRQAPIRRPGFPWLWTACAFRRPTAAMFGRHNPGQPAATLLGRFWPVHNSARLAL